MRNVILNAEYAGDVYEDAVIQGILEKIAAVSNGDDDLAFTLTEAILFSSAGRIPVSVPADRGIPFEDKAVEEWLSTDHDGREQRLSWQMVPCQNFGDRAYMYHNGTIQWLDEA